MRRFRNILVAAALLVAMVPAGSWAEESYGRRFLDKAGHGLGNVALGWVEVPKNVINISNDNTFLCGLTFGVVRGAVHAAGRTVVGALALVTSPIPSDEYVTPPYVKERLSEDTRYFGIHLPGEWTHFGPMDDGGFH